MVIIVVMIVLPIGLVFVFSPPEAIMSTNGSIYRQGDDVVITVKFQNPTMNTIDLTVGAAYLSIRYAFNDTVVYAPGRCAVEEEFILEPFSSTSYETTVWSQTVGWSKNASLIEAPNLFIVSMEFYSNPNLGQVSASFIII